jgi:uncharacterized protein YdbL (DUF1318 family)
MSDRWVLLVYRIPREPSTPRITVWRRLRRLGVAQLGDGLVGLPSDARNRERLEWIADEVIEAGGTAAAWLAEPLSNRHARSMVQEMAAARAEEYRQVIDDASATEATSDPVARRRALRRLRRQMRDIRRRDYFPPPEREQAMAAVQRLTDQVTNAADATSARAGR